MPSLETLLVFTLAALIMNLSPGPSSLYVMSRSIAQGSTAGAVAVCGLAVGSLVHVAAAAFGLSAVFVYSPLAYTILKLVGAGYLVYLGLNYLFGKSGTPMAPHRVARRTYPKILRESMLVEATNPKTGEITEANRRRLKTDMELPMKDDYSRFIETLLRGDDSL